MKPQRRGGRPENAKGTTEQERRPHATQRAAGVHRSLQWASVTANAPRGSGNVKAFRIRLLSVASGCLTAILRLSGIIQKPMSGQGRVAGDGAPPTQWNASMLATGRREGNNDLQAARIAILAARAVLLDDGDFGGAFVVFPSSEELSDEEAARRLVSVPKPTECEASLRDHVLAIRCWPSHMDMTVPNASWIETVRGKISAAQAGNVLSDPDAILLQIVSGAREMFVGIGEYEQWLRDYSFIGLSQSLRSFPVRRDRKAGAALTVIFGPPPIVVDERVIPRDPGS